MRRLPVAIMVVLAAIGSGCRPQTVLEQLLDARQLAAEILVQFTKAADATNRAVMAGTAETAAAAVEEARQATQDVQSHVDQLRPILKDLRYGKSQNCSTSSAPSSPNIAPWTRTQPSKSWVVGSFQFLGFR